MYLDSVGSLVLLLACGVGPVLIAYLVLDDLRLQFEPRPQPAVPTKPAPARRAGWSFWS